jgi:TonB-linked SusC/RagA family outer membrane protein
MKLFSNLKLNLAVFLFIMSCALQAQVKGVVKDANQQPLIGVTVSEKGSNNGTITDIDGKFSLQTSNPNAPLLFELVGFLKQEIAANGSEMMEVTMEEDLIRLGEVVVTALGIEREKKALGYASQVVSGDDLVKARETNVINSLAGKVAGVTIVGNPSGIGSSSRITIRGERSLNINNNQPLFIVDGVPINNQINGSVGRSYQEVDYGNGAGFLNPDDIESINVLKGASASSLYGSRGTNGVIVIKTKSGQKSKGLGISVNSTTSYENVLKLPEYQNKYGQGLNGEFGFKDGNGGGLRDGVDENWGPEMKGQLIEQYDGVTSNGFRGGDVGNLYSQIGPVALNTQLMTRGSITPTPFAPQPNNIKNFFETGKTYTNNISLTGSNDFGDFRASFTALNQTGIVPNTDLNRYTTSINAGYNLTDKFKVRIHGNFVQNKSDNRPNLSYGTENIMYLFNCWFPRNTDLTAMKEYWQRGRVGLNQYGFNYNYHDNPYFNVFENTNGQNLNRIFGNINLNYQFTPALNLMLRSGTDIVNEFRDRRRAYSTQRFKKGTYREEKILSTESNSDLLLSFNPAAKGDISYGVSLGANRLNTTYNISDVSAPELAVAGIYSLNNSSVALQSNAFRSRARLNSVYALTNVGYKDFLYLDLSARNDWSSTLPAENNSYLYYSGSLGLVFSELMKTKSDILSFGKLRFGVAQQGNSTDPYQLINTFSAQTAAKGLPAYAEGARLLNKDLLPEISLSYELGTELKFFMNRVGLDVSVYNSNAKNQILPVPLSASSGYTSAIVNAGLINNRGIEAMLHLSPVVTKNKGFGWDVDVNFSRNLSEVKELYKDPITGQEVKNYVMADRYITVEARVGGRMGDMYGIAYERVSSDPASKYYDKSGKNVGQIVYNTAGKPIATTERKLLGNYNPDWLAGIRNTFSYKGVEMSVLFDHRQGGELYSHTQTVGREGGIIIETLEGRADGYDLTKAGNGVIGEGVVPQADGTFVPNNFKLSSREWHTTITLGRRVLEKMVYDATYTKLREARLSYTIPNKLTSKFKVRDLSLSLVGRNLMLWSKVPHVDPETSSTSGGTIIPGVESVAIPSTKSFGLNLAVKF